MRRHPKLHRRPPLLGLPSLWDLVIAMNPLLAIVSAIFVAPSEQGKIGPDLFRQACKFGLRDRPFRAGRSPHWVQIRPRRQ